MNPIKDFIITTLEDSGFESLNIYSEDSQLVYWICGNSIFIGYISVDGKSDIYIENNINDLKVSDLLRIIVVYQEMFLSANPTPEGHYLCGIDPYKKDISYDDYIISLYIFYNKR